jgi:hypothetical protein
MERVAALQAFDDTLRMPIHGRSRKAKMIGYMSGVRSSRSTTSSRRPARSSSGWRRHGTAEGRKKIRRKEITRRFSAALVGVQPDGV